MNLRILLFSGLSAAGVCVQLLAQASPEPTVPRQGASPNPNVRKAEAQPAPAIPAEAMDPLHFYRQNPELMRRYFPHLMSPEPGHSQGGNPSPAQGQLRGTFSFPGGTAEELVEALKKSFQPAPNIIVPPTLKHKPIPEFELQNVTLADMFQALNSLSEDKSIHWQLSGSSEPIWVLNSAGGGNNAGLPQAGFAMGDRYGAGMGVDPLTGAPINSRTCQIIPVAKILKQYKIEDITTAVKTAWGMMGDDAGAQMKYHTDTKLLIVVGTPQQLNVLTQVLASLEANPQNEDDPPAPAIPGAKKGQPKF
jgi:hypothetical protein